MSDYKKVISLKKKMYKKVSNYTKLIWHTLNDNIWLDDGMFKDFSENQFAKNI